jgi:hypothetical protein
MSDNHIESKMSEEDWEDIKCSQFVNFIEGISSYGLVFNHPEIGLHGFQIKLTDNSVVVEPKSFNKLEQVEGSRDES